MVSIDTKTKKYGISDLMDQLIELGQDVVQRGLVVGSGGNLSFKDPGSNTFYITGTGTKLDKLDPTSFVQMDLEGSVVSGDISPSSEFRVHLESYLRRSDIGVCVHLHPQASVLSASLNIETKFLTIDHVYYVRKVVRIPWIRSGTIEIAVATGQALADTNVVILENHGCVIVADSVPLAFSRVLNLEEASELSLRCAQLSIEPTAVPAAYWDYLKANHL